MSRTMDVALVGVNTPAGEMMLEMLAEQQFPLTTLYPLADAESAGERVGFADQSLLVQDIAQFDFGRVRLALFVAGNEISEKYIPMAVAAGCVVVDCSDTYRNQPDIPLVVALVNPEAIAGYEKHRVIATPSAATVQLLLTLKPIEDAVGIQRVAVTSLHAVSELGRSAVEELARQTAMLLNARPVKGKLFPRQISFNVIPQVGGIEESGYSQEEVKIIQQTRRILGNQDLKVEVSASWVPVFYGHSLDVHVETGEKIATDKLASLLRKAPGIKLSPRAGVSGYPTAVTDGVGNDQVIVGRIREDQSCPRGIHFWAVADNVRIGVVLNCIQIAKILVKEFL